MPPEPDDREPSRPDRWLRPFVEESTLWPVALVAGLVLATFGAGLVLMALERNLFAVAGLLVAAWASVEPLAAAWRRRRLGLAAGLVLALWVAVAGIAAAVVAAGLF